jgi:hypothetical protein
MIRLQILIPTIGRNGIEKVIRSGRPHIDGVEYLVSWQQPDEEIAIPEELKRNDFRIKIVKTRGVARNRNSLLEMITAPLALWSDDNDLNSEEHISTVLRAFEENPDADILTFRADHPGMDKYDPPFSFDYPHVAKGYYIMTSEMAMRSESVRGKAIFNEHFGVGAHFPAGEEDLYLWDCARAGCRWRYLPLEIVHIPGDSTAERIENSAGQIATKGAVLLHLYPITWPGRMAAHILRYRHHPQSRGMWWYMKQWLGGVYYALRHHVFRKGNYLLDNVTEK